MRIDWCCILHSKSHQLCTNSSRNKLYASNSGTVSYCLLHDHCYVCPHSQVSIFPLLSWLVFIDAAAGRQRWRHPIGQLVVSKQHRLYHRHRIHSNSLFQLVLYRRAERIFRRVLECRKKGPSASPSVRPSVRPSYRVFFRYWTQENTNISNNIN